MTFSTPIHATYLTSKVRQVLRGSSLLTSALLLGTVVATADDSTGETRPTAQSISGTSLEQRVQRLEGLLEQLIVRLSAADTQILQQAEVLQKEAEEIADIQTQIQQEREQVEKIDREVREVASNVTRELQPGFSVGNTQVSYGGFIKVDAIVSRFSDTQGPASGVSSSSLGRDFYLPGLIPVGGGGDVTVYDINPRETRFLFKTATPVAGGELASHLEFDFEVTNGGNERVSSSFLPRMRQAFITYKGLLIGQAWSTFQDVAALPENLDFIGPAEGTTFNRQPMIRYTSGNFEIALENPETTLTTQAGARVTPGSDRLPDIALRYTKKGDWGQVRLAGLARELRTTDELFAALPDSSTFGYGVSLSGKINVGEKDDFRFMATAGEGLGRYVGTNLVNGAAVDNNGELQAIPTYNGFASYRHFWDNEWRSNLTFGYFKADNPTQFTGGGVTDEALSLHANLLYSPAPQLTFGIEYMFARRQLENGLEGNLNRTIFSAKYGF